VSAESLTPEQMKSVRASVQSRVAGAEMKPAQPYCDAAAGAVAVAGRPARSADLKGTAKEAADGRSPGRMALAPGSTFRSTVADEGFASQTRAAAPAVSGIAAPGEKDERELGRGAVAAGRQVLIAEAPPPWGAVVVDEMPDCPALGQEPGCSLETCTRHARVVANLAGTASFLRLNTYTYALRANDRRRETITIHVKFALTTPSVGCHQERSPGSVVANA